MPRFVGGGGVIHEEVTRPLAEVAATRENGHNDTDTAGAPESDATILTWFDSIALGGCLQRAQASHDRSCLRTAMPTFSSYMAVR